MYVLQICAKLVRVHRQEADAAEAALEGAGVTHIYRGQERRFVPPRVVCTLLASGSEPYMRTTQLEEPSMSEPKRASDAPIPVDVEEGKTYFWCACGLSKKQPFCDGSHKGTEFTPVRYQATASRKVWFCGCKQTAKAPLCDGSHNKPLTSA